jgi:hypothetical protein
MQQQRLGWTEKLFRQQPEEIKTRAQGVKQRQKETQEDEGEEVPQDEHARVSGQCA